MPTMTGAGKTRGRIALTHRGVEALRPDGAAYRICDLRCPALAVRVAPSGLKTWDVAFRVRGSGVFRRLSLGPFPAVGLDAARERTTALTNAAKAGRDLLAEEKAAKTVAEARATMAELVELYLKRVVRGRPARVLSHARLHVVRMKSLSLHFVGQKEPLQTISLKTLFHAGLIQIRPAVRLSWSARSSDAVGGLAP